MALPNGLASTRMQGPPASRPRSRSTWACGSILAGSKAIDRTPALRHDHGSRYMSNHFQKELAFPDIDSSPAFRSPEGNGCAERFIPTLKEN